MFAYLIDIEIIIAFSLENSKNVYNIQIIEVLQNVFNCSILYKCQSYLQYKPILKQPKMTSLANGLQGKK